MVSLGLMTGPAFADMEAARAFLDTEIAGLSVLSRAEQEAEMQWFIDAAKSLRGQEINVVSETLTVHKYEAEVLAGLSHRIPALSVEFVVGALDVAEACVRRLEALGEYEFNVVQGEERSFMSKQWLAADEIVAKLRGGGWRVSSGDVYARLTSEADLAGKDESGLVAGGSIDD